MGSVRLNHFFDKHGKLAGRRRCAHGFSAAPFMEPSVEKPRRVDASHRGKDVVQNVRMVFLDVVEKLPESIKITAVVPPDSRTEPATPPTALGPSVVGDSGGRTGTSASVDGVVHVKLPEAPVHPPAPTLPPPYHPPPSIPPKSAEVQRKPSLFKRIFG